MTTALRILKAPALALVVMGVLVFAAGCAKPKAKPTPAPEPPAPAVGMAKAIGEHESTTSNNVDIATQLKEAWKRYAVKP
jgi:hypothetical protein